jgi:hypothetical protein
MTAGGRSFKMFPLTFLFALSFPLAFPLCSTPFRHPWQPPSLGLAVEAHWWSPFFRFLGATAMVWVFPCGLVLYR